MFEFELSDKTRLDSTVKINIRPTPNYYYRGVLTVMYNVTISTNHTDEIRLRTNSGIFKLNINRYRVKADDGSEQYEAESILKTALLLI